MLNLNVNPALRISSMRVSIARAISRLASGPFLVRNTRTCLKSLPLS